jgi:hypothetical protein
MSELFRVLMIVGLIATAFAYLIGPKRGGLYLITGHKPTRSVEVFGALTIGFACLSAAFDPTNEFSGPGPLFLGWFLLMVAIFLAYDWLGGSKRDAAERARRERRSGR